MVRCHRFVLAQLFSVVLLFLTGATIRLHAQELLELPPTNALPDSAGHQLPADSSALTQINTLTESSQTPLTKIPGARTQGPPSEVIEISAANPPTPTTVQPTLEELLAQWDRYRKAHVPYHVRYRETISPQSVREAKLMVTRGYPDCREFVDEIDFAFWNDRSWRRPLAKLVDGKNLPTTVAPLHGAELESTKNTPHPQALHGVFYEPLPKNCSLDFDGPYPHITVKGGLARETAEIWMMPSSGWWFPVRIKYVMDGAEHDGELKEVVDREWEVIHFRSFGTSQPPQVLDGVYRVSYRDGDQVTTITTEWVITNLLLGDNIVPGDIDPSLALIPAPLIATSNDSVDNSTLRQYILVHAEPYEVRRIAEFFLSRHGKPVRIVVDERTNSIFASGDAPLFEEFQELVKVLDVPAVDVDSTFVGNREATVPQMPNMPTFTRSSQLPGAKLKVFRLEHASAAAAWNSAFELFMDDYLDLALDRRTNTLLLIASDDVTARVAQFLERVDAPTVAPTNDAQEKFVFEPGTDNTKIVFFNTVVDDDEAKRSREFIERISQFTEITVADWDSVQHNPKQCLICFWVTPMVTPERIASMIEGVKQLELADVHFILRPIHDQNNAIIIEYPALLDDPSLKPLWDHLRSQHDFELRAPAGHIIKPLMAGSNQTPPQPEALREIEYVPANEETNLPPEQASDRALATKVQIYALKNASAAGAARVVEQLYVRPQRDSGAMLLNVTIDDRTNSVIVRGESNTLAEIELLLAKLDEGAKAGAASTDQSPETFEADRGPWKGFQFRAESHSDPILFTAKYGMSSESPVDLRQQYEALEQQARSLSEQLRKPLPDPATNEDLKAQLRDTVSQAFAARQKLQRAELAEFAKRLQSIQQSIEMRETISQQIIERRVQELLDPNLKWEEPEADNGNAQAHRPLDADPNSGASKPDNSRIGAPSTSPALNKSPSEMHDLLTLHANQVLQFRELIAVYEKRIAAGQDIDESKRSLETLQLELQACSRKQELACEEYRQQLAILEASVELEAARFKLAEEKLLNLDRLVKGGFAPLSQQQEAQLQVKAAQVALHQAKALLEVYKKAGDGPFTRVE